MLRTKVGLNTRNRSKDGRQVCAFGKCSIRLSNYETAPLAEDDASPEKFVVESDKVSPTLVAIHDA